MRTYPSVEEFKQKQYTGLSHALNAAKMYDRKELTQAAYELFPDEYESLKKLRKQVAKIPEAFFRKAAGRNNGNASYLLRVARGEVNGGTISWSRLQAVVTEYETGEHAEYTAPSPLPARVDPTKEVEELLAKMSSTQLRLRYGISNALRTAVLEGKPLQPRSIRKIHAAWLAEAQLTPGGQEPTRAEAHQAHTRKQRQQPNIPNPRPDLLRDIIQAAMDAELRDVLVSLALLRKKYNGKTEMAFALLSRMEEDGIPLSVFEVSP